MTVKLLMQNLLNQTSVCFDTETTGIDALNAELVGISFSFDKGKGFYVPFPENQEEAQALVDKFKPFFESETIEKIGQNIKYDLKILSHYGVQIKLVFWKLLSFTLVLFLRIHAYGFLSAILVFMSRLGIDSL